MARDSADGGQRLRDQRRGQTLQDFVLGVSLFLVTVTFVIGFFPGFIDPFTGGPSGGEEIHADGVARTMVENLSTADGQNTLRTGEVAAVVASDQATLQSRFGLPETADLNVTVETLDGTRVLRNGGTALATGSSRRNETAATAARIVRLDDVSNLGDPGHCRPACRLVVRVW